MELITYRKTLDVHKNGVQFTLSGFETADRISRVIEVSLMASGDTIDFPLERIVAMMYVTTPGADEPSINECAIVDNKIVYNVLPITEEGITKMKLKLIETGPEGARRVLATPTFEVEVINSGISDEGPGVGNTFDENHTGDKIKPEFTALENFIAKAEVAYGKRLEGIELDSECIFKAYYADGTIYATDVLKQLFTDGNVLLSESFAHGGTGIRAGEDTDNSMYYSNVARSEALSAKNIMENSEDILSQVRQHGVYTAFRVDFNTGEVEYVSPRYTFDIDKTTGKLEVNEQTYTFIGEIEKVVKEWLASNEIVLEDLQKISTEHSTKIASLETDTENLKDSTTQLAEDLSALDSRVTPIDKGGTGATKPKEALAKLGISNPDACDYRLIKTMETGDFTAEYPKYSGYYVIPFPDFDALEYDELVFVANGNITMGQNTALNNSYSVNCSISPYNPKETSYRSGEMTLFHIAQQKSMENGWQDVTVPIKNSCVRCIRYSNNHVNVNGDGSLSYSTDTTFISMYGGNGFTLRDGKFYLSFLVDTDNGSASNGFTINMRIDIYGRKSIFNSNKEE